jgi:thiamine thiazole synthase
MSYETEVSRAVLEAHSRRLLHHLENDVVVVGAGPAGLVCAWRLGQRGLKVASFILSDLEGRS